MNSLSKLLKPALIVVFLITVFISCGKSSGNTETDTAEFISAVLDDSRNIDSYSPEDDGVAYTLTDDAGATVEDVQREIEEADIIKFEGTSLYIINRYRGLVICDLSDPDTPAILGKERITGVPVEMYIRGEMAYIISTQSYACTLEADQGPYSTLYAVSIATPGNLVLVNSFSLEGTVTESRLVGNIIYVVTSMGSYSYPEGYIGNTYVTSIDIADSSTIHTVDQVDFSSSAQYIHVTESAVFTVSSLGYFRSETSTVTYVDISDPGGQMDVRGSIDIRGYINDKFKLNYYNGYLRVCSYDPTTRASKLSVISVTDPDALRVSGTLSLGEGEQLFATRYDGDKASPFKVAL